MPKTAAQMKAMRRKYHLGEFAHHSKMKSKKGKVFISRKIRKLRHEGKPEKQAVGQAYGMARSEGFF